MDVRCPACSIEYEFDDARVRGAGVTVKCTNCGHVFKVAKDASPLSPPAAGPLPKAAGEWMVRQQNGSIFRFKELTTLQKWIVERKVGRDDEISKTGRTWKRLGEIAELTSFFQVVDAATQALRFSEGGAQPSLPPAPAITTTSSSAPPAPAPAQATAPRPPAMAEAPAPAPPQPSLPPTALADLDVDDPVLHWQQQRRRKNAAIAVVLVAIAGAAVAFGFRDRLFSSGAPGLDPQLVATAQSALSRDVDSELLAALAALAPLAGADNEPADAPALALAWKARLLAAVASHRADEKRLCELGRQAALPAPAGCDTVAAAADAARGNAYRVVTALRAGAPEVAEVHLAAAAFQLAVSATAEHQADLQEAQRRAGADPVRSGAISAEARVFHLLLEAKEALDAPATDAAALIQSLQATVQKLESAAADDGRVRAAAAALLTRAALLRPEDAALRTEARARVEASPQGDRRQLLEALLTPAAAPAVDAGPAADVAADAGVAAENDSGADAGSVDAAVEVLGYDVLMQRAERALANGKSKAAADLFQKATTQKPGVARPWLRWGWAALDGGKNAEAIRAFKRALSIDEDLSEAQFGLAEALRFSGKKAEAVAGYQLYLKMDPNGKDAGIARNALDQLKD